MFHLFSIAYQLPLVIEHGGVDKTRNTEHSGTSRNIPEHEKIKILFMKKKNIIIIIIIIIITIIIITLIKYFL